MTTTPDTTIPAGSEVTEPVARRRRNAARHVVCAALGISLVAGACNASPAPPKLSRSQLEPLVERGRRAIDQLPKVATPAARDDSAPASGLYNGRAATGTMAAFMTSVITDVDGYWTRVFRSAGLREPQVTYAWPEAGQSVASRCEKSGRSNANTAAYCSADDQIVVSTSVAQRIWGGTLRTNNDDASRRTAGDFSVAFAIAHEYAHSLQAELGLIPSAIGQARRYQVVGTELHADCWAGVWANSAYYAGSLDAGDVEEGIDAAALVGDYRFDDTANHHGTPAQRMEAFKAGYNSGVARNCDRFLATTNAAQ